MVDPGYPASWAERRETEEGVKGGERMMKKRKERRRRRRKKRRIRSRMKRTRKGVGNMVLRLQVLNL
jgi:hypothetical protein